MTSCLGPEQFGAGHFGYLEVDEHDVGAWRCEVTLSIVFVYWTDQGFSIGVDVITAKTEKRF